MFLRSGQVLVGVISVAFTESAQKIKTETSMRHREARVIETARSWSAQNIETMVSDQQLTNLRAVFDALNVNDSADAWGASLDVDELVPFLGFMSNSYLTPIDEEELAKMFQVIDTSGDGAVSWAEFLWFVLFLRHQYNAAKIRIRGVSDKNPEATDFDFEHINKVDLDSSNNAPEKDDEWGLSQSEHTQLCNALTPLVGIDGEVLLASAAQHLQDADIERRAACLYLLQTLGQLSSPDQKLPCIVQLASGPPPTVQSSAPVSAGGLLDAALPPPRGVSKWSDVAVPSFNSGPAGNGDLGVEAFCGMDQGQPIESAERPAGPGQNPVEIDLYLCAPLDSDDEDPLATKRGRGRGHAHVPF